jgi:Flp pilus assembly pilin Flp
MFKQFLLDECGQGTLEYGLVLGLIAMIAVGSLLLLGTDTNSSLSSSAASINSASKTAVTAGAI